MAIPLLMLTSLAEAEQKREKKPPRL
jgi:hypothetical protein